MISHTVKIQRTDIIPFLYPGFVLRDQISMLDADKKIIYVGRMKPDLHRTLRLSTKGFINTVGAPTLDLSNNEALLKFAYEKFDKYPPQSVFDQLSSLDEDTFYSSLKLLWVNGAWPLPSQQEDVTIYDLFSSTTDSVQDSLKTFYRLLEQYPYPVLESSFLTFLSRSQALDEQSVKPGYARLLRAFNTQSGSKVKPALLEHASRSDADTTLSFSAFLMSLR